MSCRKPDRSSVGLFGKVAGLPAIGPAEERSIVRTADGVDVSLPFSWLSDVWARGLAVTFGRLCLAAETTDGSNWDLHTLGPDLADPTELTIATW